MAKKQLSAEDMAKVREKLARTALGRPAFMTPRELEVVRGAEHYRLIGQSLLGRVEHVFSSKADVTKVLNGLFDDALKHVLVYAIMGTRDALIPQSRYKEFFPEFRDR